MTEDKRKKLELCFGSLEKIINLRSDLESTLSYVSWCLKNAVELLNCCQSPDENDPMEIFLADEGFTLDEADIDYINGQYRDSFMRTMELLVPHMKTFPTFKTQK
jgi:hypothetical protein